MLTYNHCAPAIIEWIIHKISLFKDLSVDEQKSLLKDKLLSINYGQESYINKIPKESNIEYDFDLLNTDQNLSKIFNTIKESGMLDFQLLLHGVSGTGKTEFAKYLSKQLNIPIKKYKMSDLMSKYAGESEAKIREMFEEQKREHHIILIDEAEYIIHNRSKSSQQWENSIVGEVLSNMEETEYPVILTTNLFTDVDDAILRRLTFCIKFDYMKEEQVKKAFKTFNNLKLDSVSEFKYLAPGDYAMFNKRNRFLNMTEKEDILNEFKKIQNDKKGVKRKEIGFQ
jgi:SpoVK/Ycf46/Vps4 family AAA+-type ATPase